MLKIYDFECPKCGKIEELLVEKGKEPVCKKCKTKMTKLISAPPFHLKGNGWSKDNYGLKMDNHNEKR